MAERRLKIREKVSQTEPKLPDAVIPEGNDYDDLDPPVSGKGEPAISNTQTDSEVS